MTARPPPPARAGPAAAPAAAGCPCSRSRAPRAVCAERHRSPALPPLRRVLAGVHRHLHKMAATSGEGVVLRKALRWEVAAEQNTPFQTSELQLCTENGLGANPPQPGSPPKKAILMLEKLRAGYRHKGLSSLARSAAQTVPTPGISEVGEQLQQIQAKGKKNYVSHSCYLLSLQKSLLGFRGAPALLQPLHFPRGPTMDGPSHYLPYRHAALKMLENTADCVQLLMQIPGTQLGVSRNCSRPRATFPCWAKLHEIITQLQVPFTVKAQRTGIAGHLKRQEYNPQLTNCKDLTPPLSPRIIICFGTILKHFCLFHTGLCISLELEKWESVPE